MPDAESAAARATAPAAPAVRVFTTRHVQLARAALAAVAAIMITFTPDHSATVGLSVFSGWATASALVLLLGAWLAYPRARRALPIVLGALMLVAGMVSGLPGIRSTTLFFWLLIAWALLSGAAELGWGVRDRRQGRDDARDEILIGAFTIALGIALLVVNPAYRLDYFIADAGQSFTLTGIAIGVGLFGGYAAIVAVFLGIAGLSPRRAGAVA
ncbi:acyl-CoA synthetase [Microbacterium sp.]|uniref:acyl-CoA synthetase n=1 Tax=Microbacterium sp. TaxID=51671 RepID=UPI0039E37828